MTGPPQVKEERISTCEVDRQSSNQVCHLVSSQSPAKPSRVPLASPSSASTSAGPSASSLALTPAAATNKKSSNPEPIRRKHEDDREQSDALLTGADDDDGDHSDPEFSPKLVCRTPPTIGQPPKSSKELQLEDIAFTGDYHAPNWTLGDFDVGRKLGEGQFGSVYLVRERRSNYIVALKAMKKCQVLKSASDLQLRREIEIQSHLRHPNILQIYGWFSTTTRIYMILEVAPQGELMDKLADGGLPERTVSEYMKQMISAIRHCHRRNVLHRDLKPENILIDVKGQLKLADFGWAAHVPKPDEDATDGSLTGSTPAILAAMGTEKGGLPLSKSNTAMSSGQNGTATGTEQWNYLQQRRKTFCGTYDYLAPEICARDWYGREVDCWTLGVLCYELATGGPPFAMDPTIERDRGERYAREVQREVIQNADLSEVLKKQRLSPELMDFISRSLAKNPADRMTSTKMLRHDFIRKYNNLDYESDLDEEEEEEEEEGGGEELPSRSHHVATANDNRFGLHSHAFDSQHDSSMAEMMPPPSFSAMMTGRPH